MLVTGADAERWGNAHPNLVPYQLFRAADRALGVAVGSDDQWKACADALGLQSLARDPALPTNAGRVAQRARIIREFSSCLAARDAGCWQETLTAPGVPFGIVRLMLDVVARTAGSSPLTGMPSSIGGNVRFPPPRLDEHGAQIRARHWGAFGR